MYIHTYIFEYWKHYNKTAYYNSYIEIDIGCITAPTYTYIHTQNNAATVFFKTMSDSDREEREQYEEWEEDEFFVNQQRYEDYMEMLASGREDEARMLMADPNLRVCRQEEEDD